MHVGAMAILMFIVAAISVACDSKDEPESRPRLVSFSWDDPTYDLNEIYDLYPDKKKIGSRIFEKREATLNNV